jgi:hypothetical protein
MYFLFLPSRGGKNNILTLLKRVGIENTQAFLTHTVREGIGNIG